MKKEITLEFPFAAGKPTRNGHIYSRETLKKAVEGVQEDIENRRMLGELNSFTSFRCRLEQASHRITALWLEDDTVRANIEVLSTKEGKKLAALLEGQVPLLLSPMGYGDRDEDTQIVTGYSIPLINVCETDKLNE